MIIRCSVCGRKFYVAEDKFVDTVCPECHRELHDTYGAALNIVHMGENNV